MSDIKGKVVEVRHSQDDDASAKIGEALQQMRKFSGLTQAEMARRLDVGQASVSKMEKGRSDVHVSTIQKYVEALGGKLRVSAAFDADSPLSLHVREAFDVEPMHDDQLIFPIFSEEEFRHQRDVVLSIRPQYSSKIMTGEKTVELRRRFPVSAPRGTVAYIYSTSPERAMVGVAEIVAVKKLAIDEIWQRYSNVAFIERPDFDKYFDGLEHGMVLEFSNVRPFEKPMSLTDLRERFGFEPPQSFLYAKYDLRRAIKDEYSVVSN
ncbi:helix-turn-helix domain-containing protein [uncultured Pelagimonas sp.]|uniref:helix-turn-helix domain-containing protein n=1 Tax=uncultured Pelagimonas sp. TaxID=1618102 RepID=UPI0026318333|nr:helix-turn-helix domain-containing protein [uncultured Pelagimonas sp.]